MAEYSNPEVLVTTQWVADHLNDPKIRIVEVDVDTSAYDQGHVPGAVGWNWQTQLQDPVRRDLADQRSFEKLAGGAGLTPDATVILYGDNNNWFAAWAFWQLKYYGHNDVRLMNGGRKKWLEEKRQLSTDAPRLQSATYRAKAPDTSIRAKREEVFSVLEGRNRAQLVDVRSVDEFSGKGVTGDQEVIAYCRIGERSSHTWFALKYLLGYKNVRNYDGSWTEWGNLIGSPIVNETAASTKAASAN